MAMALVFVRVFWVGVVHFEDLLPLKMKMICAYFGLKGQKRVFPKKKKKRRKDSLISHNEIYLLTAY